MRPKDESCEQIYLQETKIVPDWSTDAIIIFSFFFFLIVDKFFEVF